MTPARLQAALCAFLFALVFAVSSCGSSEADGKVTVVGPREAVTLIESGEYVVLDLRARESFAVGHVTGARSMPFLDGAFSDKLGDLDPGEKYLLYGHDPTVTSRASERMVANGFEHVVDAGRFGMLALAGAPLESPKTPG